MPTWNANNRHYSRKEKHVSYKRWCDTYRRKPDKIGNNFARMKYLVYEMLYALQIKMITMSIINSSLKHFCPVVNSGKSIQDNMWGKRLMGLKNPIWLKKPILLEIQFRGFRLLLNFRDAHPPTQKSFPFFEGDGLCVLGGGNFYWKLTYWEIQSILKLNKIGR